MIWLTWRLHRMEAAIGIALFAALIAVMLLATRSVDSAHDAARAGGCFGDGQDLLCGERLNTYFARVSRWSNLTELLHGVPLVIAALLAIPTLQELERGTHRLAWTQSISRRSWSLARLGFAAGIATLVAAVWIATAMGWRSSLFRGEEPTFSRNAFDLSPAALIGYTLFAVALALAAAVVVRRLVPVLALTAVGFIGARILTAFYARSRYRNPVEETVAAADNPGSFTSFPDRWILDEAWLSRTSERLPFDGVNRLCEPGPNVPNWDLAYRQCLIDNGFQYFRAYHPTDRVGQFQMIEMALFLGVAAGLFAFAYWWLTRRPA